MELSNRIHSRIKKKGERELGKENTKRNSVVEVK